MKSFYEPFLIGYSTAGMLLVVAALTIEPVPRIFEELVVCLCTSAFLGWWLLIFNKLLFNKGSRKVPKPTCVVNLHRILNTDTPPPPEFVYAGRGACPITRRTGRWGNPFPVKEHGNKAMRLYLDWLRDDPVGKDTVDAAQRLLPGQMLGCWCVDYSPDHPPGKPCHAEVLARLANGEALEAIRESVLERVGPEQELLFG